VTVANLANSFRNPAVTTNFLPLVCQILGLYFAWKAGATFLEARLKQPYRLLKTSTGTLSVATFAITLAIALPTALQFYFPAILPALQRDYVRFEGGEWWRLITPLFVQDAGLVGSLFNLVCLLLVGGVAEQLWGSGRMLCIFFIGGIAGEIVAYSWQPAGAGNSVGNFSLAASIAVACLAQQPTRAIRVAALLALSADLVLLVMRDIHGAAAVTGALLALALRRHWQR
jgi:rhomboid protease GluP